MLGGRFVLGRFVEVASFGSVAKVSCDCNVRRAKYSQLKEYSTVLKVLIVVSTRKNNRKRLEET